MNDSNSPAVPHNLAVVRGAVSHEPNERRLASGVGVVQFDVATCVESDGKHAKVSVPIAWHDPSPAQLGLLVVGLEVVVIGTVRRRFFRVGGATQSRTEILADVVIPARHRRRVDTALQRVAASLIEPTI